MSNKSASTTQASTVRRAARICAVIDILSTLPLSLLSRNGKYSVSLYSPSPLFPLSVFCLRTAVLSSSLRPLRRFRFGTLISSSFSFVLSILDLTFKLFTFSYASRRNHYCSLSLSTMILDRLFRVLSHRLSDREGRSLERRESGNATCACFLMFDCLSVN